MNTETDQSTSTVRSSRNLRDLTHRVEYVGKGCARIETRHRTRVEHPTTTRHDEDLATI